MGSLTVTGSRRDLYLDDLCYCQHDESGRVWSSVQHTETKAER